MGGWIRMWVMFALSAILFWALLLMGIFFTVHHFTKPWDVCFSVSQSKWCL